MKRLVACCGTVAVSLVLSCTSGDDVYITSSSNRTLSRPVVCCTELSRGGTVDASIGGGPRALVAVQAITTFAGIAASSVDAITAMCRGLAEDLDAPLASRVASDAEDSTKARMTSWCDAAAAAVTTARGKIGGTLSVRATAPVCSTPVRAKTACVSRCSGGAACDALANPLSCSSGRLTIACHGTCSPAGSAPMKCQGSCGGACQGSCTAPAGVVCAGPCDGLCKGAAEGGSGAGIQPDGTCTGTCAGTCLVTAPGAQCSGVCAGTCDAACTAPAGESVTCDGACSGPADAIACASGSVTGGCSDPACDPTCDVIAAAGAQCTPARATIVLEGSKDDVLASRLKAALESRLPALFDFEERLGLSAAQISVVTSQADAIVDIKAACIPFAVAMGITAADELTSAIKAVDSVVKPLQD